MDNTLLTSKVESYQAADVAGFPQASPRRTGWKYGVYAATSMGVLVAAAMTTRTSATPTSLSAAQAVRQGQGVNQQQPASPRFSRISSPIYAGTGVATNDQRGATSVKAPGSPTAYNTPSGDQLFASYNSYSQLVSSLASLVCALIPTVSRVHLRLRHRALDAGMCSFLDFLECVCWCTFNFCFHLSLREP